MDRMPNDSYTVFWPSTDINFIKVSQDTQKTMDEAKQARSFMESNAIMVTKFEEGSAYARYFPPEGAQSYNSAYSVYRKTPNQNYYQYLYTLSGNVSMLDYNLASDNYYHYMVTMETNAKNERTGDSYITYTVYENLDSNGKQTYYHTKFDTWTICNIEESTDDPNFYWKTGKTWVLGLNMGEESINKHLNINSQDTLGQFPKISMGSRNYDSMSFSGLLGRIYQYKDYSFKGLNNQYGSVPKEKDWYTEKMDYKQTDGTWGVTDPYATEMDKLKAWKEFITDGEMKLLRDMKGNAWIVQITDAVDYNINMGASGQPTVINFQWAEIKGLSNLTIVAEKESV